MHKSLKVHFFQFLGGVCAPVKVLNPVAKRGTKRTASDRARIDVVNRMRNARQPNFNIVEQHTSTTGESQDPGTLSVRVLNNKKKIVVFLSPAFRLS